MTRKPSATSRRACAAHMALLVRIEWLNSTAGAWGAPPRRMLSGPAAPGTRRSSKPGQESITMADESLASLTAFDLRKDVLGDAKAVDAGGHAAIDGDLQ